MAMEKLQMQVKAEPKKKPKRHQPKKSTTQEAENFPEPKILYKFYIALLDIVQIHVLCSLGVENPCVH